MPNDDVDFVALMDRIFDAIKAAGCDTEKDPEAAAIVARPAAESIRHEADFWVAFEVREGKLCAIPPWRFGFQRPGRSPTQARGERWRPSVGSRLQT
ncbi:hypothetical protein [Bradyrhizobium sp. SZCCHNRI3042]|uniref:hypothetical protein n=1 Tax=Bradyrhizobium sp. SZCCHNRI3042 TaxID=3057291 RepID=UPI0029165B38|nr:hypothetical protein [Bradyrhizobium sp. SZCCHNRI3042]